MIWPIRRVISHMYQKPSATIAARISRKPLKAAARSQSAHTVVGSALRQRAGKRAAIGPAMYVQKKFVHIEPSQRHCTDAGRFPQLLVSLSIGNVRSSTQLSGYVRRYKNWGRCFRRLYVRKVDLFSVESTRYQR